jgi:hypothetical protein
MLDRGTHQLTDWRDLRLENGWNERRVEKVVVFGVGRGLEEGD